MSLKPYTKVLGLFFIIFVVSCVVILPLKVKKVYAEDWWKQLDDYLNQTHEWFKDKANEAQDWWNQANQWAQEKSNEAQQWWNEKSQQADEWWQYIQQWGQEKAQEYWGQFEQWSEETKQKVEEFARKFEQKVKQSFEQGLEIAKSVTGPYREEAFNILEREARRQLCEEYSDPNKVGELEKRRDLFTETTITVVKLVPVYDPESGQVHTFDQFARNLYSEIPGIEGSDLARDPVRCVGLMVLDSDYLMYAKIIQTPNGKWISMAEALCCGYKVNQVMNAVSDYNLARQGYRENNPSKVENAMVSFASRISEINKESQTSETGLDPLLLAPFAIITVSGSAFLRWDSKRKKMMNLKRA
ncbi:MAG: hypothetical protein QXH20_00005 [Candidatus Bathyarchaeia archaeon]